MDTNPTNLVTAQNQLSIITNQPETTAILSTLSTIETSQPTYSINPNLSDSDKQLIIDSVKPEIANKLTIDSTARTLDDYSQRTKQAISDASAIFTADKPKRKAGRPKGRTDITLAKGKLIGKELAKGKTQLQAVRAVGYETNNPINANKIINYTNAREWANRFLDDKASKVLENLSNTAERDQYDNILLKLRDGDNAGAKVLVELLKISHKAGMDLLDRAGISKVTKHMTVKRTINEGEDLDSINKSIQALSAKLGIGQVTVNTDAVESKPEGMESVLSGDDACSIEHGETGKELTEFENGNTAPPQEVEGRGRGQNDRTTETHITSGILEVSEVGDEFDRDGFLIT